MYVDRLCADAEGGIGTLILCTGLSHIYQLGTWQKAEGPRAESSETDVQALQVVMIEQNISYLGKVQRSSLACLGD